MSSTDFPNWHGTTIIGVKKDGKVYEGAEAFLLIWNKIPKYRLLFKVLSLPIIFNIFSIFYEIVAFFLYLKNKKQLRN